MLYSFNTFNHSTYYGLAPSLPEQIAAAAAAGYDRIGLDVFSVLAHERAGLPVEALAALLKEYKLPCYELVSLSISADADATRRSLARVLEAAAVLEPAEVLCVVTGEVDRGVVANTAMCAAALDREGIGLSVEFLPTRHLDSIPEAVRLQDRVGHPNLRIVVESWHFFRGPSGWDDLAALPLGRIGFVQFADAPAPVSDDVHTESMHRRVMPGQGEFDLARFCGELVGKGYDGVVSVELLSDEWRAANLDAFADTALTTTRAVWEAAGA
ncbi:sugar phosphate isomerase/epimerase family protein [Yinghuangia seranimata]|uniref:sugar phosphate isomerase/epimerase family protein n=1 Tax=Yinghuangia seranimata TaxID=408067 RepID=UPI00248C7BB4|nr:sugar phosphate isomerase/epimerase [Yinghuangia seranimata]MDI2132410.1 sugar phosphate isomerase/epimerase [Yinghuangia seranimata]